MSSDSKERIILILQYYRVSSDSIEYALNRQAEINECLIRNANNTSLDEIHLLVEDNYDFSFIPEENRNKLHIVIIGKRLTYQYAFEYYNTNFPNQICLLANADIYTNTTLDCLRNVNFFNVFFAMNRYEHNDREDLILANGTEVNLCDRHKCPYLVPFQASIWSQDTWIWKAQSIRVEDCDFALGTPGCDNHIIYQLLKQHFFVCNPSRFICTMHIDRLSIRHEDYGIVKGVVSKEREQRVGEMASYAFVENIEEIPDKYTTNIEIYNSNKNPKYSFIKSAKFTKSIQEITSTDCTVASSSKNNCSASDIFFDGPNHWEPLPTDTTPCIEFQFTKPHTIAVLDLVGKLTLRNEATIGYVTLFRVEWTTETNRKKFEIHKGINVPNGNVIHRIYFKVPFQTTSLRLYPLKYEGVPAMKVRLFSLKGTGALFCASQYPPS